MATKNLVVRFLGKDSSLRQAGRRMERMFKTLGSASARIAGSLAKIGIAGIVAAGGLVFLTKKALNSIDKLDKMGQALGATAEWVQRVGHAAELGGSDLGQFEKMIGFLGKTLGKQLVSPSKEVTDALAKLGTTAKDLEGLTPAEAFERLIKPLVKLNELEQSGVGSALFGRGAVKNLTAIRQWADNMERVNKIYERLDLGLKNQKSLAVDINDHWTDISNIISATGLKLTEALSPAMLAISEQLNEGLQSYIEKLGGAEQISETFARHILEAIPKMKRGFEELAIIIGGVGAGLDAIGLLGRGISAAATAGGAPLQAASQAAQGDFGKAGDTLVDSFEEVGKILAEVFSDGTEEQEKQTRKLDDLVSILRGGVPAR